MQRHLAQIILVTMVLLFPSMGVYADSLPRDVVLVLDNSGSMKKNDPGFLTVQAVSGMINNFKWDTRASVIIFDQDVNLAVGLTKIDDESRPTLLNSLKGINYRGQYTDSPAAVERAIYELKNNGRTDARKIVVFMTDGIVDTGKQEMDALRTEWLREELSAEAADDGILIYSVAFTGNADLLMISTLARKTHGQYFRAEQANELESVFTKINELIYKPEPVKAVEPPPEPPKPVKQVVLEPPPPPVVVPPPPVVTTPTPEPVVVQPADNNQIMMLVIVIVVIVVVAVIIIMLILRRKGAKTRIEEHTDYVPQAFLNDIHNLTDKASYELGKKATMIGRVAGTDTENLNYLVVPQTTVGRRHALIEYKDFAYWIIDQDSVNGTFVNDEKITESHRLKHGDKIRLHKNEFEFVMPEMFDTGMTVFSTPESNQAPANQALEKMFGVDNDATAPPATGSPAAIKSSAKAATAVSPSVQFNEDVTTPPQASVSSSGSEDPTMASGSEDPTMARELTDDLTGSEAPTEFNLGEDSESEADEISFDDFMDTLAISAPVIDGQQVKPDAEDDDEDDNATVLTVQDDKKNAPDVEDSEDVTLAAEQEEPKLYDETMVYEPDEMEPEPNPDQVFDATNLFQEVEEPAPAPETPHEQIYDETMIFQEEPESKPTPQPTYDETMIFQEDDESKPEPKPTPQPNYDETMIFQEDDESKPEPKPTPQPNYAETMIFQEEVSSKPDPKTSPSPNFDETMIFEEDEDPMSDSRPSSEPNYAATMIFEADSEVGKDAKQPEPDDDSAEMFEPNFDESLMFDPDDDNDDDLFDLKDKGKDKDKG